MNGRAIKVLLIGNENDCTTTRKWLRASQSSHFELYCALNLEDGLRALSTTVQDVVLIDSHLGFSNGVDLLQAFSREFEAPLILLADEEDYEVDVAATQAGVSDYLVKRHINAPLLERSIRYAIRGKRVEIAHRRALRENNRLSVAITNLSTGIIITDAYHPDNPIIFANDAFVRLTGYPCEEILGHNCRFLQGPETDEATRLAIRKAVAAGGAFKGEILNYRKDGTPFWNELAINPIEEHGQLINFVGIINDVTERRRDEARVRSSRAQLAEAQRIAHVGSWGLNAKSDSVSWSDEMFRIFGREPDGAPLSRAMVREWIHPEDREKVRAALQKSLESCQPLENYFRLIRPGGEVRIVHQLGEVIADEGGRVLALNGTAQDVTELKTAEATLQRTHDELEERVEERTAQLRANAERLRLVNQELLVLARLATVDGDLSAILHEVTEAAARVLNVNRVGIGLFLEDRSGIRCMDSFERAPDNVGADHHHAGAMFLASDYPQYFEALKAERSVFINDAGHPEGVGEFCDSYLLPFGIFAVLDAPIIKGGELVGIVRHEHTGAPREWSLEEQTFAGSLADLVALALETIERRQAETSLKLAKEEAENANRAKSEFLSRMSHELRTPLNSILGFGQLLQRDNLTEKQSSHLDLIVSAGHHLLDLINEVLDLACVEAGRIALSVEPIGVCEIASEAVELVQPLAARRGISLTNEIRDEMLFVTADRQRLKQVLLNLLSNAVKYNIEGGRVRVWCEIKSPALLRINVSDTGAGIAPENLPRLFLPFERLDVSGEIEGTGLGLALSRHLMEAMGGSIEAQSTPGEETTFCCSLPLSDEPSRSVATPNEKPCELSDSLSVLYIEDNPANLKLIESLFSDPDRVNIMTAMQGRLGLDLAREHHPDMILLDLHLPDMEGEEVLRRLQADAGLASTPVLVLSADATPQQAARLLGMGARRYLTKPFNIKELLRNMEEVIEEIKSAQVLRFDPIAEPKYV